MEARACGRNSTGSRSGAPPNRAIRRQAEPVAFERALVLEGIENFRDYGGYAAAGGARLKRGALWRSGSHARATTADLQRLADLGLAVIIDLRRPDERRRDPSPFLPSFAGLVIENEDEARDEWREHIAKGDLSAAGFRAWLTRYYEDAPFQPRHVDLFSRALRALAEAEGPVLVHCAGGKDRTGVFVALVHHLAGVRREDIFADFLATNAPERLAKALPVVREIIAGVAGQAPEDEAVLTAIGVEAAYLERAFQVMSEQHGSVEAYLEAALGVDAALRERLLRRLTEERLTE